MKVHDDKRDDVTHVTAAARQPDIAAILKRVEAALVVAKWKADPSANFPPGHDAVAYRGETADDGPHPGWTFTLVEFSANGATHADGAATYYREGLVVRLPPSLSEKALALVRLVFR